MDFGYSRNMCPSVPSIIEFPNSTPLPKNLSDPSIIPTGIPALAVMVFYVEIFFVELKMNTEMLSRDINITKYVF